VVIRSVGEVLSPGAMAFARLLVGSASLGIVALRYRRPFPRGRALAFVLGYGVLWFAAYTVVLNWAERHLDAGTAALLVNIAPILVAGVAGIVFHDGFPRPVIVGMLVAFAGVVVITAGGTGSGAVDSLGIVLGVLTAVLYAAGVLMQKVALRSVDAVTAPGWAAPPGWSRRCRSPRRRPANSPTRPAAPSPVWCSSASGPPRSPSPPGRTPSPAPTPGAWRQPRCASRLSPYCCRG